MLRLGSCQQFDLMLNRKYLPALFPRFGVLADCISEFIVKNCQGHLISLGADEGSQSDEDFLVF
jgi:hypothetical protein